MPKPKKKKAKKPSAPSRRKRATRVERAVFGILARRRVCGSFHDLKFVVVGEAHPCMFAFWGADAGHLDEVLPPVGESTGFAVFLPKDSYANLVAAQRGIEGALDMVATEPSPWRGGMPDDRFIGIFAGLFMVSLGQDKVDVYLPGHHDAKVAGWLVNSGRAETGSAARLRRLIGKIRNALNS